MNDRYLYKAKRIDNGEWVEGDLVHSVYKINDTCVGKYGSDVGIHQVCENTICQCTGLKDKNGKLIWENDIVRVKHTDGQEEYQENAKVSYTKRGFSPFSWEYYCDGCDVRCEILEIEVTGNIFDEGSENIGKGAEEN